MVYIVGAVTSEDSGRRCSPTGKASQPALHPDSQGSNYTKAPQFLQTGSGGCATLTLDSKVFRLQRLVAARERGKGPVKTRNVSSEDIARIP